MAAVALEVPEAPEGQVVVVPEAVWPWGGLRWVSWPPIRRAADTAGASSGLFNAPGEHRMNLAKVIGVVLIAAGAIGLVMGSFSYTKESDAVKLGPLELSVKQEETVNVPVWAGIGAIAVGVVLLIMGGRKG